MSNQQTTPEVDMDLIIKDSLKQFDVSPSGTPEDHPAPGPAESEAPPAQKKPTEQDQLVIKPRFTTHEEAERGYANLQADFTRKCQEMSALMKKVEELEKSAAPAPATPPDTPPDDTLRNFIKSRREKLLEDIDALDPDADDYRQRVVDLQAAADVDILEAQKKYSYAAPPAPTPPNAPSPGTPPAENDEEIKHIADYTRTYISKPEIGLDPSDQFFWLIAANAPTADDKGNPLTLDQQIEWAVQATKNYHSKIAPPVNTPAPPDPKRQIAEQPLSRSGAPPANPSYDEKPMGLSDAIEFAQYQRRL